MPVGRQIRRDQRARARPDDHPHLILELAQQHRQRPGCVRPTRPAPTQHQTRAAPSITLPAHAPNPTWIAATRAGRAPSRRDRRADGDRSPSERERRRRKAHQPAHRARRGGVAPPSSASDVTAIPPDRMRRTTELSAARLKLGVGLIGWIDAEVSLATAASTATSPPFAVMPPSPLSYGCPPHRTRR